MFCSTIRCTLCEIIIISVRIIHARIKWTRSGAACISGAGRDHHARHTRFCLFFGTRALASYFTAHVYYPKDPLSDYNIIYTSSIYTHTHARARIFVYALNKKTVSSPQTTWMLSSYHYYYIIIIWYFRSLLLFFLFFVYKH